MVRAFFLSAGALCLGLGLLLGPAGLLIGWLGLSFLIVGLAYTVRGPALMGKRLNGSFHPLGLAVHAPFLAAGWLAWQLRRRGPEPVWNEVESGIFVGRMATLTELPRGQVQVVDLTCELLPPRGVRGPNYRCLPTLDLSAPNRQAFWAMVDELTGLAGPLFIHCAAGHGRSATLAAAVMIRRGLAADVQAAEALMKLQRPRVHLNADQRRLVAEGPNTSAPPSTKG